MFDFIEDSVNNSLDIMNGLVDGRLPNKEKVFRLAIDGLTVLEIAELTGYSINVIDDMLYEK